MINLAELTNENIKGKSRNELLALCRKVLAELNEDELKELMRDIFAGTNANG